MDLILLGLLVMAFLVLKPIGMLFQRAERRALREKNREAHLTKERARTKKLQEHFERTFSNN